MWLRTTTILRRLTPWRRIIPKPQGAVARYLEASALIGVRAPHSSAASAVNRRFPSSKGAQQFCGILATSVSIQPTRRSQKSSKRLLGTTHRRAMMESAPLTLQCIPPRFSRSPIGDLHAPSTTPVDTYRPWFPEPGIIHARAKVPETLDVPRRVLPQCAARSLPFPQRALATSNRCCLAWKTSTIWMESGTCRSAKFHIHAAPSPRMTRRSALKKPRRSVSRRIRFAKGAGSLPVSQAAIDSMAALQVTDPHIGTVDPPDRLAGKSQIRRAPQALKSLAVPDRGRADKETEWLALP